MLNLPAQVLLSAAEPPLWLIPVGPEFRIAMLSAEKNIKKDNRTVIKQHLKIEDYFLK